MNKNQSRVGINQVGFAGNFFGDIYRISGEFSPTNIATLEAWFRADSIAGLSDGAAISLWSDSSGRGRNLTQETGSKQPTYKINVVNSKPVVRFDGSANVLKTTTFSYNQPSIIFSVFRVYTNDFKYIYSSLGGFGMAMFLNGPTMYAGSLGPGFGSGGAYRDIVNPHIYKAIYNTTSSYLYRDNLAVPTSPSDAGNLNGGGFVLGNRYDESLPSQVDVAEVLIYSSLISVADQLLVSQYLSTKYGIGLG